MDNHLEINAEGYYYKYKDFHAVDFNGITGLTTAIPAQDSRIFGVEILLRALLPQQVQMDVGVNLMSAHYRRFSGVAPDGTAFDYRGNQMIDAPAATVNGGIQKELTLGSGTVRGRGDVRYHPAIGVLTFTRPIPGRLRTRRWTSLFLISQRANAGPCRGSSTT